MKKVVLLLLCMVPLVVNSQQAKVDSLEIVLNNQKMTPAEQLNIYKQLCYAVIGYDYNKTLIYVERGLALAEKEKDKRNIALFNKFAGWNYDNLGQKEVAMAAYDKALGLARELGDEKLEAGFLADVGSILCSHGDNSAGLENYMKALSIYEKLGEKQSCGSMYSNIGSIYRLMRNYDQAISYLSKAMEIAEEFNDIDEIQGINYDFGSIYRHQEEYDKALEHALIAVELCRDLDTQTQIIALQLLSSVYSQGFGDYDKALEYTTEALHLAEELGDKRLILSQWHKLSIVYGYQKRYKESEAAALKAWVMDSTHIEISRQVADQLALVYINLGEKDKAIHYHNLLTDMQVKFFNDDFSKAMADMEVRYETEKKDIRILALEQERNLYVGLGIAVILVLLFGIGLLFYRHRMAAQKRKIAEQLIKQLKQEKELIAVRSALDAEKTEREIIARDLHDGVGTMLSVVKNNMDMMKTRRATETENGYFDKALYVLEKSIVELHRVAHHIMPATLIEKGLAIALDDFCRSIPEVEFHCINTDFRFDPEKEQVLYRCAYELVNNALRHAGASHIDVHLNINSNTVYLSVVDDGRGFDPQTITMGMGINNMRARLSAFGGRMDIYSEQEKGTEVNVELDL